MALTFGDWLIDQQHRKDSIGEMARMPSLQNPVIKSQRKNDDHRNWATLIVNTATQGITEVFNEAWQEFLLAKEVAEGSPE